MKNTLAKILPVFSLLLVMAVPGIVSAAKVTCDSKYEDCKDGWWNTQEECNARHTACCRDPKQTCSAP